MNRRKTDLIIDTQAFANSCALLDNAKLREALANSEARIAPAESLLAEAGDQLMFLELAIGSTADTAYLVERIDGFLPKTEYECCGNPINDHGLVYLGEYESK